MLSAINRESVRILPKCALCEEPSVEWYGMSGCPVEAALCDTHAEHMEKSLETVTDELRHRGEIP